MTTPIEVSETRTEERRWCGVLTREQVLEAIQFYLYDRLELPHRGNRLDVAAIDDGCMTFELVHDLRWYDRPGAIDL